MTKVKLYYILHRTAICYSIIPRLLGRTADTLCINNDKVGDFE